MLVAEVSLGPTVTEYVACAFAAENRRNEPKFAGYLRFRVMTVGWHEGRGDNAIRGLDTQVEGRWDGATLVCLLTGVAL